MKLYTALFTRLGLFSRKDSGPDPFEQRLMRIGSREQRFVGAGAANLFRNQPSHQEA